MNRHSDQSKTNEDPLFDSYATIEDEYQYYIDDLILGKLLEPRQAAKVSRIQLEYARAYVRNEILFSTTVHKMLVGTVQRVVEGLK